MSEFGPDLSLVAAIAAPKKRGVLISVGNMLLGPEFVKQIENHRGADSFEIVEFPNEEYHAGTLSKTLFREVFRGTRVECLSANGDETFGTFAEHLKGVSREIEDILDQEVNVLVVGYLPLVWAIGRMFHNDDDVTAAVKGLNVVIPDVTLHIKAPELLLMFHGCDESLCVETAAFAQHEAAIFTWLHEQSFSKRVVIEIDDEGSSLDELFASDTSLQVVACLLYTSPSPRDGLLSRMPSSA